MEPPPYIICLIKLHMKSKKGKMNRDEWKAWGMNFIKFVAPTLAVFFSLLHQGLPLEKVWPVALIAFYQSLEDFFTKLNQGK